MFDFWNKKDKANEIFIPNNGRYYNQTPFNLGVTQIAGNELSHITFQREVCITFLYLRSVPTNGILRIHGDQYGPRLQSDGVTGIGVLNAGALVGTPTVNRVLNGIVLDQTNNIHYFNIEPWRTRSLYVSCNLTGAFILNGSYIFV